MIGVKHDSEKDRWDILPIGPIRQIVKVLSYGASKYPEANNWQRVPDARRRYYAAAMRHLTAWWWDGEVTDGESGLSHLAHAATCLVFLMWFEGEMK